MRHTLPNYRIQTCAWCRQPFAIDTTVRDSSWGYAYDGRLCCTYSCMRAMERDDKSRGIDGSTYRYAGMTRDEITRAYSERDARILKMIRAGKTIRGIADKEGCSSSTIYSAIVRMRESGVAI